MQHLYDEAVTWASRTRTPEAALAEYVNHILDQFVSDAKQVERATLWVKENSEGCIVLTYENITMLMNAEVKTQWMSLNSWIKPFVSKTNVGGGVWVLIVLSDEKRLLAKRWMKFDTKCSPPPIILPSTPCTYCGVAVLKSQSTKISCIKCGIAIFCTLECLEKCEKMGLHVEACEFMQKIQRVCHYCGSKTKSRCSRCKTFYCSEICRTKDKEAHVKMCHK